jgi:hypothetical protein
MNVAGFKNVLDLFRFPPQPIASMKGGHPQILNVKLAARDCAAHSRRACSADFAS